MNSMRHLKVRDVYEFCIVIYITTYEVIGLYANGYGAANVTWLIFYPPVDNGTLKEII